MSDTDTFIELCEIDLYLPGITSLKGKRGIIKSMLARLRNTFNISVAEVGQYDKWQVAQIAVVCVSNSQAHNQKVIRTVIEWIETHFPDVVITQQTTDSL